MSEEKGEPKRIRTEDGPASQFTTEPAYRYAKPVLARVSQSVVV